MWIAIAGLLAVSDAATRLAVRPDPLGALNPEVPTYSLAVDLPITLAGLALGKALSSGQVYPDEPGKTPVLSCRWCDGGPGTPRLNALDRWGAGVRVASAQRASRSRLSWVALGGGAALAWGQVLFAKEASAAKWSRFGVSAEAVASTLALSSLVKISVRRARPFTHDSGYEGLKKSDDNWSFFSGHTSVAFATVVSSARVASPKSRGRILGLGLPFAAATGYLRIASGKHYLTDVLVGAAIGAGVGMLVPKWHRNGGGTTVTLLPVADGAVVSVAW